MPASKVKKDPIIKRETSPMALANKEAEEKQAQQALKLLEMKKLAQFGIQPTEEKKTPPSSRQSMR